MNEVRSRSLKVSCNISQNIGVAHSVGVVKAWGVDECAEAAIGCGPVMDTNLRRLGRDTMSDFDTIVTGDELDDLFVE
jgi:hypothetical protein